MIAKVWIIGRTYATGIERKIPAGESQGQALTKLVEHLFAHRLEVDGAIGSLEDGPQDLTLDRLQAAVTAHGQMVRIIRGVERVTQSPRSFVSKYLHFHRPFVPIYDNVASGELRRRYRWRKDFVTFPLPDGADEEYYWYVLRFWQLYQRLSEQHPEVQVKLVDHYLLSLAGLAS